MRFRCLCRLSTDLLQVAAGAAWGKNGDVLPFSFFFRLLNGEFSSYWQSDGSARSHWIRLRMRTGVLIKQLSIAVAHSDQSYMPQLVTVSVGRSSDKLKEVKEVRIARWEKSWELCLRDMVGFFCVESLKVDVSSSAT